ncbi:uncharacterized protein LOC126317445 isoform X1 [Schistocerca gregaria]|uniref:uncharacterized protein LOC126317445 isoform X1 n=1 Tax=Schistocerca gregaria TaxID=7010 RepID=UPI00211DF97C|nr:uncharacterized protein LOC126317445 isoform X1 [Schistocerca gregaria]
MIKNKLNTIKTYAPFLLFWNGCLYVKECIWPVRRHPIWLLIFLLLFIFACFFLPLGTVTQAIIVWINSLDRRTSVSITLTLQILFNLLCLPSAPLVIFTGFSWGFVLGTLISWIGCSTSMLLCYIIGKLCIKKYVRNWANNSTYLYLLLNKIDSSEKVGWIIFFSRLSPMTPISITSYVFSITNCPFLVYLIPSIIGILPPTALCVYLGKTADTLYELFGSSDTEDQISVSNKTNRIITACIGLALVIFSTAIIIYYVSNFLRQATSLHGSEENLPSDQFRPTELAQKNDLNLQDIVYVELDILVGSHEIEGWCDAPNTSIHQR